MAVTGMTALVPLTLLKHYVAKYDQTYLNQQVYRAPHPAELMLRNHVKRRTAGADRRSAPQIHSSRQTKELLPFEERLSFFVERILPFHIIGTVIRFSAQTLDPFKGFGAQGM